VYEKRALTKIFDLKKEEDVKWKMRSFIL